MPIYEYECKKCLFRFEVRKSFSEDTSSLCPQCGSEAQRLFSPSSVVYKGSGFSTTDSKKYRSDAAEHDRREAMSKSLEEKQ